MLFKRAKRFTSTNGISDDPIKTDSTRADRINAGKTFAHDRFLAALNEKAREISSCRFCGKRKYGAVKQVTMLYVQDSFDSMAINRSIPCGAVVCEECGHVNLFALGALGLLPEEDKNVRMD